MGWCETQLCLEGELQKRIFGPMVKFQISLIPKGMEDHLAFVFFNNAIVKSFLNN